MTAAPWRPLPDPGSDEAMAQGCRCAVLDNAHGLGRGCDGEQFGWWVTEGCPLHDAREDVEP